MYIQLYMLPVQKIGLKGNNTFDGNAALYGNDFASTAVNLDIIALDGRRLTNNALDNVASG